MFQRRNLGQATAAQPPGALMTLKDVKKAYKTEAGDFYALKGIDLEINRGEFIGVVGKCGSGKSTLINMITGIDRPSSGRDLGQRSGHSWFGREQHGTLAGQNMGVVFQFFQLLPTLTVIENVMLPMDFCRLFTPKERKARAMALLERVEMAQQANKLPSQISGGQAQRVAIARSLATTRRSSWPMNRPATLIAKPPMRYSNLSKIWSRRARRS